MRPRPKPLGALFPLPPASEASLSARQQLALQVLRETDGLTGYDLGRLVHDRYGTHTDGRRDCSFCSKTGGELAKALKAKGLVTQHARGVFRAVGARGGAADRPEDPFEWPPGFGDAA